MKERIKKELIHTLEALLIGIISGLIIGIYQYGLTYVVKASSFMFNQKEPLYISLNIAIFIILSIINYLLIKFFKSIDGSGVPLAVKVVNKKEDEKALKVRDIPLTMVDSYIATYSLLTLGSEGPSISLATKVGEFINKLFKDKGDLDNIALSEGAGFGSAFLSPLAGISYSFEEGLDKFKPSLFFRSLIMCFASFGCCYLINRNHLLEVSILDLTFDLNITVIIFLLILNILVAFLFKRIILSIRKLFDKYPSFFLIKYRAFIYFTFALVLGYFFYKYLGNGHALSEDLITNFKEYDSIYLLIILLIFRIIALGFLGNGKVVGGIVLPMMCIGAINGAISISIFNFFSFTNGNISFILLLSMLMFFSFINTSPFTSSILLIETLFYSSSYDFNIFTNYSLYIGILAIFIGSLLFKLIIKENNIYEEFIEVDEKYGSSK